MTMKDVNENERAAVEGGNLQFCTWFSGPPFPVITTVVQDGDWCIGIRW